ncbi:senescence-specific cysteine protease sag39 [Cucumis melo var. makuwa]|uniref:Senescence-specific cysteine protease sag39 n=1 Tax=Cucumis melo var. makuwa TaxID=1194695 RepID=A0A5A7T972_CUCMM|nr:senescence-specific cysteine protease sag39 [Cucumis melo var. makuwa]TYK15267.1 senescence-specific cysteine protease sag39 [Cucumis melo var. makuwa]
MINSTSEDFQATLDVVRNEIADVNMRLNLTIRAMTNQAPVREVIPVSKVKIPEPPSVGKRDAKALENFIFDLEQYFKATNTVTEEAKVTFVMMHLFDDAKLWWSDSQDVRCYPSFSPRRNRNSRPSSPKAVGGDKRSSGDPRPYQSNTENI